MQDQGRGNFKGQPQHEQEVNSSSFTLHSVAHWEPPAPQKLAHILWREAVRRSTDWLMNTALLTMGGNISSSMGPYLAGRATSYACAPDRPTAFSASVIGLEVSGVQHEPSPQRSSSHVKQEITLSHRLVVARLVFREPLNVFRHSQAKQAYVKTLDQAVMYEMND